MKRKSPPVGDIPEDGTEVVVKLGACEFSGKFQSAGILSYQVIAENNQTVATFCPRDIWMVVAYRNNIGLHLFRANIETFPA
jgi:hypothetical protein